MALVHLAAELVRDGMLLPRSTGLRPLRTLRGRLRKRLRYVLRRRSLAFAEDVASELLRATNAHRLELGLREVESDPSLELVTMIQAGRLATAGQFRVVLKDGHDLHEDVFDLGGGSFQVVRENLLLFQDDAASTARRIARKLFAELRASGRHRQTFEARDVTCFGAHVVRLGTKLCLVQALGAPRNAASQSRPAVVQ